METPFEPASGYFSKLPNLLIKIGGEVRGAIETRDWERWAPDAPYTNWWWITLRRDDGVWVEGSCSEELSAQSLEGLEAATADAIARLQAVGGVLTFEKLQGNYEDPEPPEAEDGDTSELFRQVDQLCTRAIRSALAAQATGQ